MSSALDITRAVSPPRAVFTDFPLGHTAGKAFDRRLQRQIMIEALGAFETMEKPGSIRILPFEWDADHSWKHAAGAGEGDNREERTEEPHYQSEEDKAAAQEGKLAEECIVCSDWSAGTGERRSAD
jgi:hypothetical protein